MPKRVVKHRPAKVGDIRVIKRSKTTHNGVIHYYDVGTKVEILTKTSCGSYDVRTVKPNIAGLYLSQFIDKGDI